MRLLFLTPQLPYPPHQGAAIRNYHLIAHLAQHHIVDLITFAPPSSALPATDANPLHRHCRRLAFLPEPTRGLAARARSALLSPLPDMALRLESAAFHRQVAEWIGDGGYDIVQVEGIELAQYARHARAAGIAAVFDNHNCEYLLQQRNALTDVRSPARWHAAAYSLLQWAKLRRYEARVCRHADAVIAVSHPDAAALQAIAPAARILVAPNAIELADYDPAPSSHARTDRFTLLFTGKMDYRPNIDAVLWFAHEVWPLLNAGNTRVHWQIVGMNPHPRLDPLRGQPNIEITGAVPDIRPYLDAADAYIIPMRVGGGTRFKALEAMAGAKAIVSTTLGVEGIDVQPDRHLLLADHPKEFAAAIRRLVTDRSAGGELSRRLGAEARAFVAAHYTWDRVVPSISTLYMSVRSSDLVGRA